MVGLIGDNMEELFEVILNMISLGSIDRKEKLDFIMTDVLENPIICSKEGK